MSASAAAAPSAGPGAAADGAPGSGNAAGALRADGTDGGEIGEPVLDAFGFGVLPNPAPADGRGPPPQVARVASRVLWNEPQTLAPVWTLELRRNCAIRPAVHGAHGAGLFECADGDKGLWYELLRSISEDTDMAERLESVAGYPSGPPQNFGRKEFGRASRSLSRMAIAPAAVRGLGKIGPGELEADEAIGAVMQLLADALHAFDMLAEGASSRGSRTGASYRSEDGSQHRSRIAAFCASVDDGDKDGDCRLGPGQVDQLLENMGIEVSPFKLGPEHAHERLVKRRALDVIVKAPFGRIASRPKTVRQSLEFASASANPRGAPLKVDALLSDWAELLASPGCISGLVDLINPKLPPTAKMGIIFEAMASLKNLSAVAFIDYPVEDAGAYTLTTVHAAEASLAKLEFSFKFRQSHDGAASASAMLGPLSSDRKLQSAVEFQLLVSEQWADSLVRSARAFVSGRRSRSRERSTSPAKSRRKSSHSASRHRRSHRSGRAGGRRSRSCSASSSSSGGSNSHSRSRSRGRRSASSSSDSSNDSRFSSQQFAKANDPDAAWHKSEFRLLVGSNIFSRVESLATAGDRAAIARLLFRDKLSGKADTMRNLFLRAFSSDFYRKRKKEGDLRKRIRHCMTSVRNVCGTFVKYNMDLRGDSSVGLDMQTIAWHSIRTLDSTQFLANMHVFGQYPRIRAERVGIIQKDAYLKCVKNALKALRDNWGCLVDESAIRTISRRMDGYQDATASGAAAIHSNYVTPIITDLFRRARLLIDRTHRNSRK